MVLKFRIWLMLTCGTLLLSGLSSYGQAELKTFAVSSQNDTILLDSMSIIESSFSLKDEAGQNIPEEYYKLDPVKGLLIWNKDKLPQPVQASASFKTFPFSFYRPYAHKKTSMIQSQNFVAQNPFRYSVQPKTTSELMELGGLEKSGSISRGVGFGNNRDLSVSSNMNLQFSGKIASNLFVTAAISDENIPIQPEGNTQQLQDFDQVYIKVYNDDASLTTGDFQLKSDNSYFTKYFKRAQGLTSTLKVDLPQKGDSTKAEDHQMDIELSGAISRGKFARNIIQGVEGNQGPYRLRGEENEPFIIILSGTERVYIDGKLLTRGQSEDYIINYNTAEIIFTARQLITKDKRIIVEFQYSDQNYTRTLFQFSNDYKYKNLELNFNLYSEQDAKNQSLQQELSDEQKFILADVGDSLDQAFSSSAKQVEFTENEVLYKMTDSLGYDSVFVFSSNPDSALWRVTFTKVGAGNGDYILLNSTANGRVFQWVEPASFGSRGDYAPIVVLYSPKQRQLISLGGKYAFSELNELSFEGAISNDDVNTFSQKDTDDNIGYAFKSDWKKGFRISDKQKGWVLSPIVGIEHWGRNFKEIERIRTVEFYRDWNIRNLNLLAEQNIYHGGLVLEQNKNTNIEYRFEGFDAESDYNAQRHKVNANVQYDGFTAKLDASTMESGGNLSNTNFTQHNALVQKRIGKLNIGYKDDREDNRNKDLQADTLAPNAYAFWEREYYIQSLDSAKNFYKVFFGHREDYKSAENDMRMTTYAENYGAEYKWRSFRPFTVGVKSVYRKLDIRDQTLTIDQPDENFLSRVEYNLRLWKGALTAGSFYEVGSGLEAKREYKYIEVLAGQGQYTWIDANDNGIQEINEFEIAVFSDEAKYIRIFILTDDYVKVFTNQFNQSLNINPSRVWNNKTGILKLLSAFSNQTAYRMDRKTQQDDLDTRFNPLPYVGIDSQLVSLNSSFRNTVYLNRSHPIFGLDFTYQDIKGRALLSNGIETRTNVFRMGRARWNITRMFLLESEGKWGKKTSSADFVTTRNFDIDYYNVLPKLSFQPGVSYHISLLYEYKQKLNAPDLGGELAVHNKAGIESRIQKVGKGSILLEIAYINIEYTGLLNGSIDYEMLEGLQPGDNGTWQVTFQRNIGKYLQLNLGYNGRSTEGNKSIHTGTVRMRAYF